MVLLVGLAAVAINAFRPAHARVIDVKVGSGPPVKVGDTVVVHYVGKLADSKEFDSSKAGRPPFDVAVGKGVVIKGWDVGMVGMQVGGVRRLIIPPEEGYGPKGIPPIIPPNATLTFEVDLIGIK